jgi:hypothetical protein
MRITTRYLASGDGLFKGESDKTLRCKVVSLGAAGPLQQANGCSTVGQVVLNQVQVWCSPIPSDAIRQKLTELVRRNVP